jgi:hypothetical protein
MHDRCWSSVQSSLVKHHSKQAPHTLHVAGLHSVVTEAVGKRHISDHTKAETSSFTWGIVKSETMRRTPVSNYPSHLDGMDNCNRLNSSWDWSRLARLQISRGNSPLSYTIHGLQDHNDAPRSWSRCVSFIFKDVVLKIQNTPDASQFSIDTGLCKAVACALTRQSSGLEKASQDCQSDLFLFLGTCFQFVKDKGCSLSTLCSSQQSSLTCGLNPR